MPIDFNGINPNGTGSLRPKKDGVGSVQNNPNSAPKPAAQEAPARGADQVSFSSQARDLKNLENSVRRLPDVDQSRVARIKAALADGSYKIDNEKLAGKLLDFEEEIR